MKTLSVRQPWLAMIVHGQKRIENRSRRTAHRGLIALHASGRSRWDFTGQTSDLVRGEWRRLDWAGTPDRDSPNITHGAVLAVAEIVDVCGWQGRSGCDCGEWAVPFQAHWRLANVRPLAEPVPCKGALGLWTQLGSGPMHEPFVKATRYEVSVLPEGNVNRRYFVLHVEYRRDGQWVVCQPGDLKLCYGKDGSWEWESGVTDEWIAKYRHDLDTAMRLAKEAAPLVEINGRTAAEVLARSEASRG
jgi:hypothetical protein